MSNHAIKSTVQPWMIRKTAYLIIGAVCIILGYFGFIDEQQVNAVTASPVLGTLVAWVAAAFTHEGSDSKATDADVAKARDGSAVDVEKLATEVAGKLLPSLPIPLPVSSSLPVYSGPTSQPQG